MGRRQNDSAHPPEVRPVDVDGVRTVAIVTVGWGVAFVALALRQSQLNEAGNGWWLWTCLAGVGLGLLGLEYCRKRRDAIAQAALDAEAEPGKFEDESAVGDWSRLPPEDPDFGVGEQLQPGEQGEPAEIDRVTQPYQHAEQPPGNTAGDMPPVPGQAGQPVTGYPGPAYAHGPSAHSEYGEPHTPPPPPAEPRPSEPPPRHYEPSPQRPAERPRAQQAPQQQPSMPTGPVPSRPAVQRPAAPEPPPSRPEPPPSRPQAPPQPPPSRPQAPPQPPPSRPQAPPQPPPSPPQAPPQPPPSPPQAPPQPPPSPPQQAPSPPSEPAAQDSYSTGVDPYGSAAGYTPDADRARRHPRDLRPETSAPSGPAAEPPRAGRERQGRRPLEDSEFFGEESNTPAPNSTAEFLLADLEGGDDEPAPPASHDRDAPDDEYRGRRTRRLR